MLKQKNSYLFKCYFEWAVMAFQKKQTAEIFIP